MVDGQLQAQPTVPITNFSGGVARFSGLNIDLPPNSTVTLKVLSGASLTARDGDVLDLRIASSSSVTVSGSPVNGSFPIDPSAAFPVDGMSSFQLGLFGVSTPTFAVGTTRNLALDVRIPANGYDPDVLQRIAVQNLGTARPSDDITGMEVWRDDGDGTFKATADTRLGPMVFTGDRWQLSGLSVALPVSGMRLFVTADIAELYMALAFVEMSMAENYCNGIPLGSTTAGVISLGP